jgi:antitoxin YefM
MIARSYSNVRQHFKEYCDKAANDAETIIVTRERGENVVILSEAEYNNLTEKQSVKSIVREEQEPLPCVEQPKRVKGKKKGKKKNKKKASLEVDKSL